MRPNFPTVYLHINGDESLDQVDLTHLRKITSYRGEHCIGLIQEVAALSYMQKLEDQIKELEAVKFENAELMKNLSQALETILHMEQELSKRVP